MQRRQHRCCAGDLVSSLCWLLVVSLLSPRYVFLNDTLVAPIDDNLPGNKMGTNITTRSVWIPPGTWTDAWTGDTITATDCNKMVTVTVPYERMPMWHRCGGLTILNSHPGVRAAAQDWSTLTLEAHLPCWGDAGFTLQTERALYSQGTGARTEISMVLANVRTVMFSISAPDDGTARAWVIRVHLRPGQCVAKTGLLRGDENAEVPVIHLQPVSADHASSWAFAPFGGAGGRPAPNAGPVAELRLTPAAYHREIEVEITDVCAELSVER